MITETIDRSKFIGASEIGAIMGLSPFETPLSLWAKKTGALPLDDLANFEAAEWGVRLEEVVAQKFSQKNGVKLMAYKKRFVHPKYDFISCELDRIVVGTDELVEVKTCNAWLAKKWAGDEIPLNYVAQVNLQLGLAERKKGHFAVLVGGSKYLEKFIEFDEEFYNQEIEAAVHFWETFVLSDVAPMASEGDSETLFSLFPSARPETIHLDGEKAMAIDELIESRSGALESKNHCEEELDKIDVQIKQMIGEAEAVETDKYIATWKNQTRQLADIEKLKNDGIFEKYKKLSSSRVLRTKQRS